MAGVAQWINRNNILKQEIDMWIRDILTLKQAKKLKNEDHKLIISNILLESIVAALCLETVVENTCLLYSIFCCKP